MKNTETRVMIVDDSSTTRETIRRALSSMKNVTVVAECRDGELAVQVFQSLKPDLVTMDLTMPRLDGFGAIKEMISRSPNVKIVVCSALADEATALDAIDFGAVAFVAKPFSAEEINEVIRDVVAGK